MEMRRVKSGNWEWTSSSNSGRHTATFGPRESGVIRIEDVSHMDLEDVTWDDLHRGSYESEDDVWGPNDLEIETLSDVEEKRRRRLDWYGISLNGKRYCGGTGEGFEKTFFSIVELDDDLMESRNGIQILHPEVSADVESEFEFENLRLFYGNRKFDGMGNNNRRYSDSPEELCPRLRLAHLNDFKYDDALEVIEVEVRRLKRRHQRWSFHSFQCEPDTTGEDSELDENCGGESLATLNEN